MPVAYLLVDGSPLAADSHFITVVALVRSHEIDTAVAMPVVVALQKQAHTLAGLFHTGAWATWLIRPGLAAPRDFVYVVRNSSSENGLSLLTRRSDK